MDPAITSLMTIAGSGIAAYYGAYFKKRGEDKAIEDNFSKLLAQTRKTTEATKAIEAKISRGLGQTKAMGIKTRCSFPSGPESSRRVRPARTA